MCQNVIKDAAGGVSKCDKRRSSPSKIEGGRGSMKALTSIYNIDYQPIPHHHTPPPFGHLLYLRGGVLIRFRILTHPLLFQWYWILVGIIAEMTQKSLIN